MTRLFFLFFQRFLLSIVLLSSPAFAEESAETKPKPSADRATTPVVDKLPASAPTPAKSDIMDILDSMGYPELQVVPRASERLVMEAKSEDSTFIFSHWTLELSGLATLGVGFTAKSNERTDLTEGQISSANSIASVTTTVGAGWLIGSAIYGAQRPYRSGEKYIAKITGKDEHSVLLRERMAEEVLERQAKIMKTLSYISVITNCSANLAAAAYSNDSGKVTAGLGVILSFLPLIFEDHSIEVYEKHIEYKRKIYAPIQSASIAYDPAHRTYYPMSKLIWLF